MKRSQLLEAHLSCVCVIFGSPLEKEVSFGHGIPYILPELVLFLTAAL